jgi:Protein of unknown function (DUF2490)
MGQVRQSEFISKQNQLLFQYGLTYNLNQNLTLGAGHAFSRYYPVGEFAAKSEYPEHRFWQHIILKSQIQKTEWLARFRVEQRFLYLPRLIDSHYAASDTASLTYRLRVSNKFSIPINKSKIEDKSYYVYLADELFINAAGVVNYNIFDQNRFQLGLGYVIPKAGRIELGYVLQSVQKSDGIRIENNHFLSVNFIGNIDLTKYKK